MAEQAEPLDNHTETVSVTEYVDARITPVFDAIGVMNKRLEVLENYLPVLQEHFAGRIAGTGATAVDPMETLAAAPVDEAKAAIEATAGIAAAPVDEAKLTPKAEVDERPAYMR